MTKIKNKHIIRENRELYLGFGGVSYMNWREYGAEKKNEMELPLLEKVKATWTGLSVVFWYAALILIFGRPVLYLVIQAFRFAAFSWLSIQDWCCGGNSLDYLNPFYQLAQFSYSNFTL